MAAYDHLPIFKAMLDATVLVENTVKFFSRYHKYTLGSELRSMCHDALGLIMEANSLVDKTPALSRLRVLLERIKIHLVIAREVKAFHKPKTFLQLAEKVVNVSRQLAKARNAGYHVVVIKAERRLDGKVQRRLARLFRAENTVEEGDGSMALTKGV